MLIKDNPLFEKYYDLLAEWNEKFNLTAVTDRDGVYLKHFEDSIAAAPYIPKNAALCDIGSGAGFPGIPLKIVRPDLRVTLLDSLRKRVIFLREVINKLELTGITALHLRAEDAAASRPPIGGEVLRETFDVTAARAVADLRTLCEYALPLTKTGGKFIAYKSGGYKDELASAERAAGLLGGGNIEVKEFAIGRAPESNFESISRSLIIIEKIKPTPTRYPRSGNKPKTQPL